jgi:hypothetical protein
MFGADTHHPPEHPVYQVNSNNNIRCTVKKPESTLETNEDLRVFTTSTSHQAKNQILKMNMVKVVEETPEIHEEREEVDVTHTDRNMQHRKEEPKQKCGLNHYTRPRPTLDTHEDSHTITMSPPRDLSRILLKMPSNPSQPSELD